tara:strand:+ start:855 stop:1046 length:192 start_codon:yes stop_codon:yes gene_type:complete
MDWKRVPLLDEVLVQYLREKVLIPKYDQDLSSERLARDLARYSGSLDVISAIEALITLQKKER